MPRCHTCLTTHLRVWREISPRVYLQTSHVSLVFVFARFCSSSSSCLRFFLCYSGFNFNGIFTKDQNLYVYRRRGSNSVVEWYWWFRSMAERHLLYPMRRLCNGFFYCPCMSFSCKILDQLFHFLSMMRILVFSPPFWCWHRDLRNHLLWMFPKQILLRESIIILFFLCSDTIGADSNEGTWIWVDNTKGFSLDEFSCQWR